MTITLAINGHDVGVNDGASVLDAINQSGRTSRSVGRTRM